MPKDPSLLGKMFEVEITSTGKHFLKGSVVQDSLLRVLPRPQPLPPGQVSGAETHKSELVVRNMEIKKSKLGRTDFILLAIAGALLIALLSKFINFMH